MDVTTGSTSHNRTLVSFFLLCLSLDHVCRATLYCLTLNVTLRISAMLLKGAVTEPSGNMEGTSRADVIGLLNRSFTLKHIHSSVLLNM